MTCLYPSIESESVMAGHSHWSKIKRAKGATDAKRGKLWSKIARKIIIAAKAGGGDPAQNLTLRYTIDEAKAVNMPKDTIANAIKKGTGELGGENYETATYEGYGPGGIAILIEALTNNRARIAPELRMIFEKAGGNLATTGSVSFQFAKLGLIHVRAEGTDEDALMEQALDAGADDVRNAGEMFEVITSPTTYLKVKETLERAGLPIEGGEVASVPQNVIAVDSEIGQRIVRLVDTLEDNDDVQSVSHNAELPETMVI